MGSKFSSESKLFGGGPLCPRTTSATMFAAIIIKTRVVLDDDEYGDDGLLLILMRIKNLKLPSLRCFVEPMTAKRRVSTPAILEPKVPARRYFHHCYHHSLNYRHRHHNFLKTQNICPFHLHQLSIIISLLPLSIFQLFVSICKPDQADVDNTDCLKALPSPLMLLTLKSKCAFHGF